MLIDKHLEILRSIIPNGISIDPEDLKKHAGELFHLDRYQPDLVCYPSSEEQVIKIVDFCIKQRIPLIPYGSGTSVEGHTAAIHGGICLDMRKMQKILEVNIKDGYVIVEPGLPYNELNKFLAEYGYHFPVEAGWGASIGGMVATNASGSGATDAGSMSRNVLGCDVVVHKNNSAIKVTAGTKALKSSAGYNILNLFIGSEGTLGVFTKIILRIRKNFPASNTICCQFDNLETAIDFAIQFKPIVNFRKIELLDKLQTAVCISFSKIKFLDENKHTILFEFSGTEQLVTNSVEQVAGYLRSHGAENYRLFSSKEEADEVWIMRKNAGIAAIKEINPNKKAMVTDICVPLSNLFCCINSCYDRIRHLGLNAPMVAHIGDGNFHFTFLFDPENSNEVQIAREINERIVAEALKFGGTCTGEHGIGMGKISSLQNEHGDLLFIMKSIKKTLDPLGIFNPGKVINVQKTQFVNMGHYLTNEENAL